MEKESVISFIRIMQNFPKLQHKRKGFQKVVNEIGDKAFKKQKESLLKTISKQKNEIMECFDIYEKLLAENDPVVTDQEELIKMFIEHTGIQVQEESNDRNQ